MGFKTWTEEEEQIVRDFYKKVPVKVICEKLGRTKGQVEGKALRLGLSPMRPETKEKHQPKVIITEHAGYRVIQHYAI